MFSAVAEAAALTSTTTRPNTYRGDDTRTGEAFSSMIDSNLNAADSGNPSPAPAPAPRRLSATRDENTNPAYSSPRSTPAANSPSSALSSANAGDSLPQSATSSRADANEESHTEAAAAETVTDSAAPSVTATPDGETPAALPADTPVAALAAVFLLPDQATITAPGEPADEEQVALFGPPPVTVSDKLPMVGAPTTTIAPGGADAVLADAAANASVAAGASPLSSQSASAIAAEGGDAAPLTTQTAATTTEAISARDISASATVGGTASAGPSGTVPSGMAPSVVAATAVPEQRAQNDAQADEANASDTPAPAADVRAAAILASTPRAQSRATSPTATAVRSETPAESTPAGTAAAAKEKSVNADTGLLPAEAAPESRGHAAPSTPDKPTTPAVAAQAAVVNDPSPVQVMATAPQTTHAQAFTALTAVASNAQPFTTPAAEQAVPLAGLAVEIAARAKGGTSRFDIRLDPPELGRVDVRMNVDSNGQVTTHLIVERSETLDLLRRDAPQLQQALQDSGLKTGDSALQFSLRDQSQRQTPNDSAEPAVKLVIQPEETLPPEIAGRSYGRMLSASGGLDIRV